jgi:hypothetical protein
MQQDEQVIQDGKPQSNDRIHWGTTGIREVWVKRSGESREKKKGQRRNSPLTSFGDACAPFQTREAALFPAQPIARTP